MTASLAGDTGPQSAERARLAQVDPDLMDDYVTLKLLSAGLARIQLERQRTAAGNDVARADTGGLPAAWHAAVTRLWWRALERGVSPPRSYLEVLAWCRRPFREWPLRLRVSQSDAEGRLLEDGQLSAFANEAARLAPLTDAEGELVENMTYARLLATAETNGTSEEEVQANYVALRRFLIDHPVVSDLALAELIRRFPQVDAKGQPLVKAFFLGAYRFRKADGPVAVQVCGECGNPLNLSGVSCGTVGCCGRPGQLTLDVLEGYYVQHRGVRCCMHDPGLVERRLFDGLADLATERVTVHPWWGMDACDVAVEFHSTTAEGDSEWWAGDAKDCASATLLGRSFRWDPRARARRRLLILPHHRFKQADYVADLEKELEGRVSGVQVISEKDFVQQVRARADRGPGW